VFIAMNRFKIAHGFEAGFEELWRARESYLSEVPGFESFQLLLGHAEDDHKLYDTHNVCK